MDQKLHVVTGAFGYSGRWVAHQLLDMGMKVRTLTNALGRDDPFNGEVEVHKLDFNDYDSLVESLKGAEVLTIPTGLDITKNTSNLLTVSG